jgi:hypothetical protein
MTERKRNRIYKSPLHPPCREHCNRVGLCLPCGNARSPSVCQQHLSRDLQTQAHLCLREGLNAVNQITYCSNLTKCSLGVTRHQPSPTLLGKVFILRQSAEIIILIWKSGRCRTENFRLFEVKKCKSVQFTASRHPSPEHLVGFLQ